MKRTNAKSVGEIIQDLLQKENLNVSFQEHQATAVWPEIVGQGINRYTIARWVDNGVLYVRLSSASLRNELMMSRTILKQRINEVLGNDIIKDIIFK